MSRQERAMSLASLPEDDREGRLADLPYPCEPQTDRGTPSRGAQKHSCIASSCRGFPQALSRRTQTPQEKEVPPWRLILNHPPRLSGFGGVARVYRTFAQLRLIQLYSILDENIEPNKREKGRRGERPGAALVVCRRVARLAAAGHHRRRCHHCIISCHNGARRRHHLAKGGRCYYCSVLHGHPGQINEIYAFKGVAGIGIQNYPVYPGTIAVRLKLGFGCHVHAHRFRGDRDHAHRTTALVALDNVSAVRFQAFSVYRHGILVHAQRSNYEPRVGYHGAGFWNEHYYFGSIAHRGGVGATGH